MALTPGLLLSDRYRLTHRIAVGGMGEVWAADDTRLARKVAVKILRSELTSDPEFVDRFRAEARITASLNHAGIAAVYDYGEVASIAGGPRDTAYLVMELVTGEPLSAVLVRTPRLSVPRVLDVLEQSGRALQVAHARNLVHRDIKPGNLLITPAGIVKITDFGIAKVAHQVPVTRGGMVMGTAQYLSPEQAAGHEARPASDVYALGVVAYECLAGVRPFNGDNPVAVAQAQVQDPPPPLPLDIPPAVAGLVMRMLAKDPTRRFPDGASLAVAVARVRTGGSVAGTGAFVTSPPPPPSSPVRAVAAPVGLAQRSRPMSGPATVAPTGRRTGIALLIALLVVVIAGAAGVYLVTRADGADATEPAAPTVGWAAAEPPRPGTAGSVGYGGSVGCGSTGVVGYAGSPCGTGDQVARRVTGPDAVVVGAGR